MVSDLVRERELSIVQEIKTLVETDEQKLNTPFNKLINAPTTCLILMSITLVWLCIAIGHYGNEPIYEASIHSSILSQLLPMKLIGSVLGSVIVAVMIGFIFLRLSNSNRVMHMSILYLDGLILLSFSVGFAISGFVIKYIKLETKRDNVTIGINSMTKSFAFRNFLYAFIIAIIGVWFLVLARSQKSKDYTTVSYAVPENTTRPKNVESRNVRRRSTYVYNMYNAGNKSLSFQM